MPDVNQTKATFREPEVEQIFFRARRAYYVFQTRDGLWGWQSKIGNDVMTIAIPISVITGQVMFFKSKRGAVRHAYATVWGLRGHSKQDEAWGGSFEPIPILKDHDKGPMINA